MKANLKSFFAISLILLFAISQSVSPVRASDISVTEEKIYSNATIEDDFADDRVMVVLRNDVSLNFKAFSEQDFSEVGCVSVTDLSTGRRDSIQKRLQAASVAGVAALMLSIHPELTPTQLKEAIMDNVDQVAALANLCFSGGRLNAYKALSDDDIHSYVGNANGHSCSGTRCNYSEPHTVRVGSKICTVCGYDTSGLIMRVDSIVSNIA